MIHRRTILLYAAAFLAACSSDEPVGDHDHEGSGGDAAGGVATGGKSATGGGSTGGSIATGGTATGGASPISGGAASAGRGDEDASAGGGDAATDGSIATDAAAPALTIRFKAKVGAQDFRCGQSYPGVGSTSVAIQPLDFRFFVQNVWLVKANGDEVPMTFETRSPWQTPDVALLDFEERRGLCFTGDAATNAIITGDVPPGAYTGVAFSVGVPASLNHTDPASYPAPLQSPGMPWSWLAGFRFLKAEVQGPSATFGVGYAHPGSTSCSGSPQSGTVTCQRPNRSHVRLSGFDAAIHVIVVDVAKIFEGSDLSVDTECHGSGAECAPMFSALGIDLATGKPGVTQTAFRVE